MLSTAIGTIERYAMFPTPGPVTVALSGGADSMALLHLLLCLRERYGLTVAAAHLNHCLRGEQSERDEAFVRDFCEAHGVPLTVVRRDVAALARASGEGLEQAGRRARYEWFATFPGRVALAHTASDALETTLFHLCRGAGLRGLCGIPPVRGAIVRPLIECTRAQVEAYCAAHAIPFVQDASNADCRFARNRLRHRVVPELKEINPGVEQAAVRAVQALRRDEAFLAALAKQQLETLLLDDGALPAAETAALDPALRLRVLEAFAAPVDAAHLQALDDLLCSGNGTRSLSRGRVARLEQNRLTVRPAETPPPQFSVRTEEIDRETYEKLRKVHTLLFNTTLDCDKIVGKLTWRVREPGDCLRLAGHTGTKTLKKWMNEKKIPVETRAALPVLCDEEGPVWVAGLGVAHRVRVEAESRRLLRVFCEPQPACAAGVNR